MKTLCIYNRLRNPTEDELIMDLFNRGLCEAIFTKFKTKTSDFIVLDPDQIRVDDVYIGEYIVKYGYTRIIICNCGYSDAILRNISDIVNKHLIIIHDLNKSNFKYNNINIVYKLIDFGISMYANEDSTITIPELLWTYYKDITDTPDIIKQVGNSINNFVRGFMLKPELQFNMINYTINAKYLQKCLDFKYKKLLGIIPSMFHRCIKKGKIISEYLSLVNSDIKQTNFQNV